MDIQQQVGILKSVAENPQLSQRQLAQQSGLSLGKLNYCLNALIDKGLIKVENFRNSDNKTKYIYLLTPQGVSEKARLTKKFLQLKLQEYDSLKAEITYLQQELIYLEQNND